MICHKLQIATQKYQKYIDIFFSLFGFLKYVDKIN